MPARPTYAVVWRGRDGVSQPGRLTLGPAALRFEGGRGRPYSVSLPWGDVSAVRMASVEERLGSRPTLVLERSGGSWPVSVASVAGPGALQELHERVLGFVAGARAA